MPPGKGMPFVVEVCISFDVDILVGTGDVLPKDGKQIQVRDALLPRKELEISLGKVDVETGTIGLTAVDLLTRGQGHQSESYPSVIEDPRHPFQRLERDVLGLDGNGGIGNLRPERVGNEVLVHPEIDGKVLHIEKRREQTEKGEAP